MKTLTYSAMHFVVAVTVTYALTRSMAAALSVGLVEPLVQTLAYHLHERAWAGRRHGAEAGEGRSASPEAAAPACGLSRV